MSLIQISKTVTFNTKIHDSELEEQYIRSGGKDPYVLTLLTRAYGDGKKGKDHEKKSELIHGYESMSKRFIWNNKKLHLKCDFQSKSWLDSIMMSS